MLFFFNINLSPLGVAFESLPNAARVADSLVCSRLCRYSRFVSFRWSLFISTGNEGKEAGFSDSPTPPLTDHVPQESSESPAMGREASPSDKLKGGPGLLPPMGQALLTCVGLWSCSIADRDTVEPARSHWEGKTPAKPSWAAKPAGPAELPAVSPSAPLPRAVRAAGQGKHREGVSYPRHSKLCLVSLIL